jgi:cleavage stimulation factor subunit 3
MAEEDAEIALLHQMQAGQENLGWGDDGGDQVTEGDPSNTEHNNETVKRENVADDQVLRALSPSGAGVSDGGDYDPSSVTPFPAVTLAVQNDSRSSSRASSRKPKTVGGFIAEDSDEEDDASTPDQTSGSLQLPTSNTPSRAISPSPLQNFVTQEDLHPPENQGDSRVDGQASYSLPVNPSVAGLPSMPAPATQVLTSAAPAQPKARLPHDKMGILEDRIKEDPRGDLDAWLSLISEHRSRNKLEDARAVYEKFLKLFPQAVSSNSPPLENTILT